MKNTPISRVSEKEMFSCRMEKPVCRGIIATSSTDTSPTMSSESESNNVVVQNGNKTWLGYAIAIITFGAAFGNMFLAGKIRNVMKMNIPNPAQHVHWNGKPNSSYNSASSQSQYAGAQRTANPKNKTGQSNDSGMNGKTSGYDGRLPSDIAFHLYNLDLPNRVATEQEIKEAYRQAALKYHPDRLTAQNSHLKSKYEKQFNDCTQSYQTLLQYFKDSEKSQF